MTYHPDLPAAATPAPAPAPAPARVPPAPAPHVHWQDAELPGGREGGGPTAGGARRRPTVMQKLGLRRPSLRRADSRLVDSRLREWAREEVHRDADLRLLDDHDRVFRRTFERPLRFCSHVRSEANFMSDDAKPPVDPPGPPRAAVQTARRLMYLNFACSDFSTLLYLSLGVGLLAGAATTLLHLYTQYRDYVGGGSFSATWTPLQAALKQPLGMSRRSQARTLKAGRSRRLSCCTVYSHLQPSPCNVQTTTSSFRSSSSPAASLT